MIGREVARGERDMTAVLVSHNDHRWHCFHCMNFSLFFTFLTSAQFLLNMTIFLQWTVILVKLKVNICVSK